MRTRELRRQQRSERGAIAVVTAITAVVLLVTAALAVDIGNTWARRGMLQKQADQAAMFAAQYLPANTQEQRLQVAKAAAYYVACHPVSGQTRIDPSIPSCPPSPESTNSSFTSYANRLLADGNVTFPTDVSSAGSYVKVQTPAARIDFGLGSVAGPSGSVQVREATARIGSPGTVAPMAMSLNCMLDAANDLSEELGDQFPGVLPMNYIAGAKVPNGKIDAPEVTREVLGCARMIKSPRHPQQGTGNNLDANLVDGLDHALGTHPDLLNSVLPQPLTVDALLNAVGGSGGPSSCNHNKSPDVLDNGGVHATPNCVMPVEGSHPFRELTNGMLGQPTNWESGRLVCTDEKPCRRSFTLSEFGNVPLNDDRFEDFIVPGKEDQLTAKMFLDLDAYLQRSAPVITPKSILSPEIYDSARFMWVPVISTPTDSNRAGSWPIVSFRPVFITQEPPTSLESLDTVLEQVDSWVKQVLGVADDGDDHGLLLDESKENLLAVRFVTIEPSALPAVPQEYGGPVSDYVGTGVKVVRLVR